LSHEAAVDLWLLGEHDVDPVGAESILSADERSRSEAFAREPDRRRHRGGRFLLRKALSAYAPVAPAHWRFSYTRYGRPELRPNPWQLDFNLSHTEGMIACAVTTVGICGVDVEVIPEQAATVADVAPMLAPAEQEMLAGLPVAARAVRFTELWVLKEAYLKALGTGLSRELSSFTISIRGEGITVRDGEEIDSRWRFALVWLGRRHVCGVAVRSRRGRTRAGGGVAGAPTLTFRSV
jgi:4'-phosphopantetheinyl transferase